jgi:anti-sigma B factor antagonist
MKITKEKNEQTLTLLIEGSINTQTSGEFETAVKAALSECPHLVIDLAKTEYVSSAGLRVFLDAENLVGDPDNLVVKNLSPEVKEVFDMTGFSSLLHLE